MATVGLDKLYYAKITEGANGEETYAVPVQLHFPLLRVSCSV